MIVFYLNDHPKVYTLSTLTTFTSEQNVVKASAKGKIICFLKPDGW